MKVFLSYTHKDKEVVEYVAIQLKKIIGQDNVFYDSWSIQPGEGIIDRMNTGMEIMDYFLFQEIVSKAKWLN